MSLRTRAWKTASTACSPIAGRRRLSATPLERQLQSKVQSYISTSHDPHFNLSIEHYLLQQSSAESVILFQYVNRPSIIIGRNQNPWLEVDLVRLRDTGNQHDAEPSGPGPVDLVRRRSGGGTVFHDGGNVNWTVICPSAVFTRDKHAEMVVRALRRCGIDRARVNRRHDLVLDPGDLQAETDPTDTHLTPYTTENDVPRPLKISGSAYKLTRGRALHHGTCLLSSPNLNNIPQYLHSPAKSYISARGVESVSSPVTNVCLNNDDFSNAVQECFEEMYYGGSAIKTEELGGECSGVYAVALGYSELKSREWTYSQTPQFTLSNASDSSRKFDLSLSVRHGTIVGGSLAVRDERGTLAAITDFEKNFTGLRLHEIASWEKVLASRVQALNPTQKAAVMGWLCKMLPEISMA